MSEQEIRADVEIAGGAESSHVAWRHCAHLLALLDAERARSKALRAAAQATIDAWEDDEIGQIDGGPIEDMRAALSSEPPRHG